MDNFNEYFIQGEPNKIEKAKAWQIATGLQDIDGLKTSSYLIETAKKNIEGEINIQEVKSIIHQYYEAQKPTNPNDRTEEADKVSIRIAEILGEANFSFSPIAYLQIHKRLFQDVYDFAGQIRKNNISKKEAVLNGESVLYGDAQMLMQTLEYDLQMEKNFSYKGLNSIEIVNHLAEFISAIWQNHIFSEGNTRTTAIFLIKYLHKLGFKDIDNTLFAENALYFRNALVRANYEHVANGIYRTNEFLIKALSNLVLGTKHILKNRDLHIEDNTTENIKNKKAR